MAELFIPLTARTEEDSCASEKKVSLWEGFEAFLMRSNVIGLAVAVVIGAAFPNVVNAVVREIINPLVGAFGTQDLEKYSSCLQGPCVVDPETGKLDGIEILWGSVLSAALSSLITAAVVYFLMVMPMAKYLARRAAAQAAKEGVQETLEVSELEVLKEIRDALASRRGQAQGMARGGRAQPWWGGFSSRKRARSAALPPAGARSPHPWSVSSADCRSSGSSKIRAGLGLGSCCGGSCRCDGFESRGPEVGAVLMPPGYGGAHRSFGSIRHSPRTTTNDRQRNPAPHQAVPVLPSIHSSMSTVSPQSCPTTTVMASASRAVSFEERSGSWSVPAPGPGPVCRTRGSP